MATGKTRSETTKGSAPARGPRVKVELVGADEVPHLIEKIIALVDPAAREGLRDARKQRRADAKRYGDESLLDLNRAAPQVRTKDMGLGMKITMTDPGGELGNMTKLLPALTSLNRDLSQVRVGQYRDAMTAGAWWFTPDPIVVTDRGQVINGQHRLAAACYVDWGSKQDRVPQFVVVWGVDKKAALLMDEAKRSNEDRRNIALRFASVAAGHDG